MAYLLDTDICIAYLKGKFSLNDKVKSVGYENCFISEITIAELYFGIEKSENHKKHGLDVIKIEQLFTTLPIFSCFKKYAKERYRLQKLGILIPDFDLLIGSTAIENSFVMVTGNEKHFKRIDGINIENWKHSKFNQFIKLT